ncbi:hypothetical protein ABZ153_27385 [Streptomyces sp. NPDC006290]|jgi:hypothetical protein|uniref:hypothetical protein n=1 Tax=Streptomyces sp. NPDC006290 TaxID=3156745 RepID=UPI0033BC1317
MSQSTPPSGPPVDKNPYADQPTDQPPVPQPGVPQQTVPQGAPQPGFPVAPVAPATPARNNFALGAVAAVGAGVVSAVLYGLVIGLTKHEIGYAAVGVGFLVGIAAGRLGGRNQTLPVVSVIVSVAAIYLGQLIGEAMIGAKETGLGFSTIFFDHFDVVQQAWKDNADPLTFAFFAIAAYVAFQGTRKAGL